MPTVVSHEEVATAIIEAAERAGEAERERAARIVREYREALQAAAADMDVTAAELASYTDLLDRIVASILAD